jgi:hypothetical protein
MTPRWLQVSSNSEVDKPFGWSHDNGDIDDNIQSEHGSELSNVNRHDRALTTTRKAFLDRTPIVLPKYMEIVEVDDNDAEMNFKDEEIYFHMEAGPDLTKMLSNGRRRVSL